MTRPLILSLTMFNPNQLDNVEPELLKTILEPLFDDFLHWFGRTKALLESSSVSFLSSDEQTQLLQKITHALQEVKATQALFSATGGQAGVDIDVVKQWHLLVTQCWSILIRSRQSET